MSGAVQRWIQATFTCAGCAVQETIWGKGHQNVVDRILERGWALVSMKKEIVACPRHNPARSEFTVRGQKYATTA